MLNVAPEYQTFFIHPKPAPGSAGITPAETPTLQPFLVPEAQARSRASVVVCPGGGYQGLAPHEGDPVARWLNSLGVSAFVLRYRIRPHSHPVPLSDAKRAIRFVRHHAAGWGLDPARIGILGFSAGGHLASAAATHYDSGNPEAADPIDRVSSKPQIQLLLYPVISLMDIEYQYSFTNLAGAVPEGKLREELSNELSVNAQTPPAFLFHSTEDKGVPPKHSDLYVDALKKHGVAHAYVRGAFGPHGIGLNECWTPTAANFLKEHGF